jgi:hypothetical protein
VDAADSGEAAKSKQPFNIKLKEGSFMDSTDADHPSVRDAVKKPRWFWFVVVSVVFLCIAWGSLPLLSLFVLRPASPAFVERLKSVLAQFGTFGDMFGALNTLFSGLALFFAIYAILFQSRQIRFQAIEMLKADADRAVQGEREQMTALMTAVSVLAQVYMARYAADPARYDQEYEQAPTESNDRRVLLRQYTVRGKLEHHVKSVEDQVRQLRETGRVKPPWLKTPSVPVATQAAPNAESPAANGEPVQPA